MLGYSPISAIDRTIQPCPQYDKYFAFPNNGKLKRKMLNTDADVDQTIDLMMDVINKNYNELDKAKHLVKGKKTHETAKKIFDFIYNHIKYNLEPGEILHTPAAVYYHGQVMARQNPNHTNEYPIDCDDMAIMACSFLKALHLPWSLRIASYDGIKYGHVYCVVPGEKEIIIDPVYIGFNKEKPYKMQKTFVGSTEGMAGIPVYLQSVNGLAGLGSETAGLVTGLISGTHYSGFNGLGNDKSLKNYLQDTLTIAKKRPDLVAKTYPKPYIFEKMLSKAIAGLDTKEEDEILDILAEQEKQFIDSAQAMNGFAADNDWYYDENPDDQELSGLNYRTHNGERYFNVGNLGFFGRLKLLRKVKQKLALMPLKVKSKFRKKVNVGNRTIKMLNKGNPVIKALQSKQSLKPIINPVIIGQKPIIKPVIEQKPVVVVSPVIEDEPIEQINQNKPVQYDDPSPIIEETETIETQVPEQEYGEPDQNYDESDEETEELIEGLAGGKHFALSGLGQISDNQAILGYLKDTLKVVRKKPGMAKAMYKRPYVFQSMLDKAIKGLEADEESEILDILAEQEKQELIKPLSGLESDLYYIDGLGSIDFGGLGFFGRLGLFKKLKEKHREKKIARLEKKGKTAKLEKYKGKIVKRDARAEKRKEKIQNVVRIFNKVNPVTVAARNGLRVLIGLNFFGLATKLSQDKESADKVRDLFKKMGGEVGKINKSIINGAKKKPLEKKDGNIKTLDGFEGLGELGAIIALTTVIGAAGKIVSKIFEWIKKKREEKKNEKLITSDGTELSPVNDNIEQDSGVPFVQTEPGKPKFFKKVLNFAKDSIKQQQDTQIQPGNDQELIVPVNNQQNQLPISNQSILPVNQTPTKAGLFGSSKIGLWAAGIAGVAALAYFATNKPKQEQPISGYKRLSGIKLK